MSNDATAKAFREFVVEFENINAHVFQKSAKSPEVVAFKHAVLTKARGYLALENPTLQDKLTLRKALIEEVRSLKGNISSEEYFQINKYTQHFFRDAILFHPERVALINESEPLVGSIAYEAEKAFTPIQDIKEWNALTERLFQLSDRERRAAFNTILPALKEMALDSQALGTILSYFPPGQIKILLKASSLESYTHEAFANLFRSVDTSAQRSAVFRAILPELIQSHSIQHLDEILQYLTHKETRDLIKALPKDFQKALNVENSVLLSEEQKNNIEKIKNESPSVLEQIITLRPNAKAIQEHFKSALYALKSETVVELPELTEEESNRPSP